MDFRLRTTDLRHAFFTLSFWEGRENYNFWTFILCQKFVLGKTSLIFNGHLLYFLGVSWCHDRYFTCFCTNPHKFSWMENGLIYVDNDIDENNNYYSCLLWTHLVSCVLNLMGKIYSTSFIQYFKATLYF